MTARVLIWAVIFASVSLLERITVLLVNGAHPLSRHGAFSILFSLPEAITIGLLLAVFVFSARALLYRCLAESIVLSVLVAQSAALRYEVIFNRLPTAGVFFYVADLDELMPSLIGNTSPLSFFYLIAVFGLLLSTTKRLQTYSFEKTTLRRSLGIIATFVVLTLAIHCIPVLNDNSFPWRRRTPLGWLAETSIKGRDIQLAEHAIGPQSVLWFQQALGHPQPFGGALAEAPLCGPEGRRFGGEFEARSVIVIVMESVGIAEMRGEYQGQAIMPQLSAFADKHMLFENVKAAGTKSGSAMPAVFSGLPPQTEAHLLHRVPLNTFEGFPQTLKRFGYRNVYLHGADLTWEFQRSYLRMIGLDEIHERDPLSSTPIYGWGYCDGEMLQRLKSWIHGFRAQSSDTPFFAALFTLSSHDPYDLPPTWHQRFEEVDARSRQFESLAYLDTYLGEFLDWYDDNEATKGTILVLVGDHTPHLMNTTMSNSGPIFRYDVPLIIAGDSAALLASEASWSTRLGAQQDIPATIMHALGLPTTACDQGVSLLLNDDRWPEDRIVYSVGGEDLEDVQLWSEGNHVLVDRQYRGIRNLGDSEISDRMQRFLRILFPLNRYLMDNNAYAAKLVIDQGNRAPLPQVKRPLFISHRGNSSIEDERPPENSREAIRSAFASGFDWVEIDIQLSRDGVPLLAHDPQIVDNEGISRPINSIDFSQIQTIQGHNILRLEDILDEIQGNFIIELKPQQEFSEQVAFAETVAKLVRSYRRERDLIIDSFSLVQVTMAEPVCGCSIGWDLPFRSPISAELLNAALLAHVEWIFVEHGAATAESIAEAHRVGLKVMLYTINDVEILKRFAPEYPDGVITDRKEVFEEFLTQSLP